MTGQLAVPGDKSISHRALIFSALAEGTSGLTGLGTGADIQSTLKCLRKLGVDIDVHEVRRQPVAAVKGKGLRGLTKASTALDCANSGTTIRLMMGVLAAHPFESRLEGDESLSRRPMGRVAKPLAAMGAKIKLAKGDRAPLTVKGAALHGIDFISPVASAQLKSAVLLAGLQAEGDTSVLEPAASRDHTELMLAHFGVEVRREGLKSTVKGGAKLRATPVRIPGDPSSAAFWAVAATLVPGSELELTEVLANPTRTAFLDVLDRMGAAIGRHPWPASIIGAPEPIVDLTIKSAVLKATDIPAAEVPGVIDEIPILALAASQAEGVCRFQGLGELRHKESDRLAMVAGLLTALGAKASVDGDDLVVTGPAKLKGAAVPSGADHRIAMTALIAGLIAEGETSVEEAESVAISYPSFYDDLKNLAG